MSITFRTLRKSQFKHLSETVLGQFPVRTVLLKSLEPINDLLLGKVCVLNAILHVAGSQILARFHELHFKFANWIITLIDDL